MTEPELLRAGVETGARLRSGEPPGSELLRSSKRRGTKLLQRLRAGTALIGRKAPPVHLPLGDAQLGPIAPGADAQLAEAEAAMALIARLSLETWRLRRRLDRAAAGIPAQHLKPLTDSVARFEDALARGEIEFRDHLGERYVEGLRVEVLHVRDEGDRLEIVETIQPSILLRGRVVHQAQVVVGASAAAGADVVEGGSS